MGMIFPLPTSRLRIEPLEIGDLETFVSYRQDPDIARFQSWEPTYSKTQAEDLIQSQAGVMLPEKGEWLQLALHDLVTGELIGDLALHQLADEDLVFEIGFTVAKGHQGKGFAKEAAAKLVEHLFAEVGAKRVVAATDARNISSRRVLLGIGFEQNPDKGWEEEFKNEFVQVDFFESTRQETPN
jgi:RimJ/RimL family protein N-acetyltransferase